MGWHHLNPEDEYRERAMPEIEVWADLTITASCRKCGLFQGAEGVVNADDDPRCPDCGKKAKIKEISCDYQWYYWYCVPGCLPSSECFGPYQSEQAAIDAARGFNDIDYE